MIFILSLLFVVLLIDMVVVAFELVFVALLFVVKNNGIRRWPVKKQPANQHNSTKTDGVASMNIENG